MNSSREKEKNRMFEGVISNKITQTNFLKLVKKEDSEIFHKFENW
jgi:hypothetical protein